MTKKKIVKKKNNTAKFSRLGDQLDHALLQQRIVKLNEGISAAYVGYIIHELYYLTNESKKPIRFIINSPGGYVYDGFMLYNTLRDLVNDGVEIVTEARGLCASMAAIVLQAGSRRRAYRNSKITLHEVGSMATGKTSEMEEEIKEIRRLNNQLRDIFAKRTGHSKEEIDKMWTKKNVYFNAEEALKFNLIDEIID